MNRSIKSSWLALVLLFQINTDFSKQIACNKKTNEIIGSKPDKQKTKKIPFKRIEAWFQNKGSGEQVVMVVTLALSGTPYADPEIIESIIAICAQSRGSNQWPEAFVAAMNFLNENPSALTKLILEASQFNEKEILSVVPKKERKKFLALGKESNSAISLLKIWPKNNCCTKDL